MTYSRSAPAVSTSIAVISKQNMLLWRVRHNTLGIATYSREDAVDPVLEVRDGAHSQLVPCLVLFALLVRPDKFILNKNQIEKIGQTCAVACVH